MNFISFHLLLAGSFSHPWCPAVITSPPAIAVLSLEDPQDLHPLGSFVHGPFHLGLLLLPIFLQAQSNFLKDPDFDSNCPCLALVYFGEDDPWRATAFSVQEVDSSTANIAVVLPRDYLSRLIIKCGNERVIHDSYFE